MFFFTTEATSFLRSEPNESQCIFCDPTRVYRRGPNYQRTTRTMYFGFAKEPIISVPVDQKQVPPLALYCKHQGVSSRAYFSPGSILATEASPSEMLCARAPEIAG